MNTFSEVMEKLKKAETVALFAHENPDGDALGSMSAAKAVLEHMGKTVFICLGAVPHEKFSYLEDWSSVCNKNMKADTALCLDCGAFKRLGSLGSLYESIETKLAIDHHISNTPFADCFYTNPHSAACCELIYDMAIYLLGFVPPKAMKGLYTGLSTDTGHFKYSNVTEKTLSIAAKLIGAGLDHRSITNVLYDTVKKQKLKFMGEVYSKIEFFSNERISFFYCSCALLKKYDIVLEDVEELPNTILSIEGVKVGILLKDREDGGYKVSMRGKDVIDLASIAACFGGGGHVNAAGLSIDGDKDEILKSLIEKIEAALGDADYER
ncbi:MAG: bifunctional oligoribonuclease/PAP phosphatase NrnA [Ruminococcaceae bacterium]|nr:bifunctional oligoribonuclease/PAP phosphatase NrnA [Oscillospiraceae bacterium]